MDANTREMAKKLAQNKSMSNSSVPGVYKWVMDDVIEKMARRFAELGLDEHILHDLQTTWENKIVSMNVADFVQLPLELLPVYLPDEPQFHYQLPAQLAQPGYRLQQHDGPVDHEPNTQKLDTKLLKVTPKHLSKLSTKLTPLAQTDGNEDDEEEEEEEDESVINSDLDDEDSEDENADTDHLILCQYEKVTRIKNKWRIVLKDGIGTINGRDYLFNKATGEFEW